jgi:hypothetical protein
MSSACRQAYAHEWTRLMVLLGAMQGVGKPGISFWSTTHGAPHNSWFEFPGYSDGVINKFAKKPAINSVKQVLYRILLAEGCSIHRYTGGENITSGPGPDANYRNVYPRRVTTNAGCLSLAVLTK